MAFVTNAKNGTRLVIFVPSPRTHTDPSGDKKTCSGYASRHTMHMHTRHAKQTPNARVQRQKVSADSVEGPRRIMAAAGQAHQDKTAYVRDALWPYAHCWHNGRRCARDADRRLLPNHHSSLASSQKSTCGTSTSEISHGLPTARSGAPLRTCSWPS
jgi:hypothetical protein